MSKTYSDAYALGQKDGETGENRLSWRAFKRTFTNPGSYLPGAGNRDDEWIKGYRQGFEDRVRELRVAPPSTKGSQVNTLDHSQNNFSNTFSGAPGGSGGGGSNTFAYRISVAESLYEQIVRLVKFIENTATEFDGLFEKHQQLVGEFFFDLQTDNVKPRKLELEVLAEALASEDAPAVRGLIEKYQTAVHGKLRGGIEATKYFTNVNTLIPVNQLGLSMTLDSADPRDYETQLTIARSIRRIFEDLKDQVDSAGKTYDSCAKDHDQLMKQDFDQFIRENVQPRLQTMSDIWRNINNRDIVAIDDVISRILTASNK